MSNIKTPEWLKRWFVIHFIADIIAAVPLLIAPEIVLKQMGWIDVDPYTTRLVAAALFGIGTESLLCRNAPLSTFKNMVDMKIIWSFFAITGLIISLIQNAQSGPLFVWITLIIFVLFNFLWIYWKIRIKSILKKG